MEGVFASNVEERVENAGFWPLIVDLWPRTLMERHPIKLYLLEWVHIFNPFIGKRARCCYFKFNTIF